MKRITRIIICLSICILTLPFLNRAFAAVDENVALDKKVTASSRYSDSYSENSVVDGNEMTAWASASSQSGTRWILIDLGEECEVKQIIVRSRRDMDQSATRMAWILQTALAEDLSDAEIVGRKLVAGPAFSDLEVMFDNYKRMRYVQVQADRDIVISEIEVYGHVYTPGKIEIDFSDTENNNYKDAAALTTALGVMQPDETSLFGITRLVTRGEAADFIAKTFQCCSGENTNFNDVSGHQYETSIVALEEKRIISQAQSFYPDDFITTPEFLSMLIKALDCDYYADYCGGYPTGYVMVAKEIGLLKNTDCEIGGYINKGNIAAMLFSALNTNERAIKSISKTDVTVGVTDTTLLESKFGCLFLSGIVEANSKTSFYDENDSELGYVKINNKQYFDKSGMLDTLIGKSVCFIYDVEDDTIVTGWSNLNKNISRFIRGEEVISLDSEKLEYWDSNDKKRTLRFSTPLAVLKNGVAYLAYTEEDFKKSGTEIYLTDNDNDGVYEFVELKIPEIMIADGVNYDEGTLVISGKNGEVIVLEEIDNLSVLKDKAEATVKTINPGELLFLYISENKKKCMLEVYSSSVTGKVSAISADTITVDNIEYTQSQWFKERFSSDVPNLGDDVTINLDDRGYVYYMIKETDIQKPYTLGVILSANVSSNLDQILYITIFTEDNKIERLTSEGKIYFDGKKQSIENIAARLDPKSLAKKAVAFKLNNENKIVWLCTEDCLEESFAPKRVDVAYAGNEYRTSVGIYSGHNLVTPVRSDSKVFVIPTYGDLPFCGTGSDDLLYQYINFSSAYTTGQTIDSSLLAYNEDDFGRPKFFIKFVEQTHPELLNVSAINTRSMNRMVVKEIGIAFRNNETCFCISGRNLVNGLEVICYTRPELHYAYEISKIMAEKGSWLGLSNYLDVNNIDKSALSDYIVKIDNLKAGDIINYLVDGNGDVKALERVAGIDLEQYGDGSYYALGDNVSRASSTIRAYAGVVKRISVGDNIVLLESSSGIKEVFSLSDLKSIIAVSANGKVESVNQKNMLGYIKDGTVMHVFFSTGVPYYAVIYE